jgi:hypothetical protein
MKRSVIVSTLVVVMSLAASSMFAVTVGSTNTNNVTATVTGGCAWITPLTMAFGNYDPLSVTALTQTANVKFKCVKKTNATDTYKVWFNKNAGNMINGADSLAYDLRDNGTGTLVPTSAATALTLAGTPGVAAAAGYTFTVRGTVAAGQDVSASATNYIDTVVANIEY